MAVGRRIRIVLALVPSFQKLTIDDCKNGCVLAVILKILGAGIDIFFTGCKIGGDFALKLGDDPLNTTGSRGFNLGLSGAEAPATRERQK